MAEITVKFRMEEATLEALRAQALLEDCDPGTLIKDVVQRDLYWRRKRPAAQAAITKKAKKLRSHFAPDLRAATDWEDLSSRLKAKGYGLREGAGSLALFRLDDGVWICPATAIGCGHAALTQRFGAPFPGHEERQQLAFARAALSWTEA